MRRLLVLLALAASFGSVSAGGVLLLSACGGNDKPPLTPDNLEPAAESAEAGAAAPAPPAPSAPAKPAK